jgi:plasmid maintenance system antidote protein VapI
MIHIGNLIKVRLHEQGRTVTWFAASLNYTRVNIYKIFNRESIDTDLLYRISCLLQHDFFDDLSKSYHQQH